MNKKGQSLIIMIILMPLLFTLIASSIEVINIYYQKHHVLSVTKTFITKNIDSLKKNDIIKLYDDNNISYEDVEIDMSDEVKVYVSFKVDSFLGKLINKDYYLVNLSVKE